VRRWARPLLRPFLEVVVQTPRTKLRRMPERGSHDRAVLDAILDEALVCHVGFVEEDGRPVVIPTGFVRDGDRLILHGSKASRMLRHLAAGKDVCVTVTLIDGLVLARSGFNHSMNYRSAVVFGRATPVPDTEKEAALRVYMERLLPGRWDSLRPASAKELLATEVVSLPLDEASAKVRDYGVKDDAEDAAWPVWAGIVPLALTASDPIADAGVRLPVPPGLAGWSPTRRG
jgi:nitroimidazol reductase NimA-like FMN-containing flavoprotein (pyridoxamine 5'-phosphate oxidase superfamily)